MFLNWSFLQSGEKILPRGKNRQFKKMQDKNDNQTKSPPRNYADYANAMRRAGIRLTRPRQIIFKILADSDDHPDAMEIFRRAVKINSSISLASVYRTMSLLERMGTVHRHSFEGGPARFEHAASQHHDHLIDLDSGDVIEFHSETIEQLQKKIADELGYDIVRHRLELYGRKRKK